jgi:hypothetical protein
MGVVKPVVSSPRARSDDVWLQRATENAIAAARKVVAGGDIIPPKTPVGNLSDVEIGWIAMAAHTAFIMTHAEQATVEGLSCEDVIRMLKVEPSPWDMGAIVAILGDLASEAKVDWNKPLKAWSRDEMVGFLMVALSLIRKALVARDGSLHTITRATSTEVEIPF